MSGRCVIDNCNERAVAPSTRLCRQHYRELYRCREKYADAFTDELNARFDDSYRVDAGGCWIWMASQNGIGIPLFKTHTRHWVAFRYAYLRYIGDLKKHSIVLHTCSNVLCVNPDHLYVRGESAPPDQPRVTRRSPGL